ncbi:MAG: hypothetical protein R2800_12495 [Flavipsychrobacter sp.]
MIRQLLLLCTVIIMISSCSAPRVYFPDRVNTPGLKEKGDGNVVVAANLHIPDQDTTFTGFDWFSPSVDLNYAFSDNFGVIASYRSVLNRNRPQPFNDSLGVADFGGVFNGYRFDLGFGFFSKMGSKGLVEIYLGGGAGEMSRRGSVTPVLDYNTKYYRYFVQPAIGFYVREKFSVMWGSRFVVQKYTDFTSNDPLAKYYITDKYFDIGKSQTPSITSLTYAFAEPFVNLEFGGEVVKFNMQFGLGFRINGGNYNDIMPGGGHMDFGVKIRNPHQLFKK